MTGAGSWWTWRARSRTAAARRARRRPAGRLAGEDTGLRAPRAPAPASRTSSAPARTPASGSSRDYSINQAWLDAAMTGCILLAWLKLLALDRDLAMGRGADHRLAADPRHPAPHLTSRAKVIPRPQNPGPEPIRRPPAAAINPTERSGLSGAGIPARPFVDRDQTDVNVDGGHPLRRSVGKRISVIIIDPAVVVAGAVSGEIGVI
jgi:hypothetical protein